MLRWIESQRERREMTPEASAYTEGRPLRDGSVMGLHGVTEPARWSVAAERVSGGVHS